MRRWMLVVGWVACAACGDASNDAAGPSENDAGDAAAAANDAGTDGSAGDAGGGRDSGAEAGGDSGSDSGPGADSGSDSGADAGAGDAGNGGDAGVDAGATTGHVHILIDNFCNTSTDPAEIFVQSGTMQLSYHNHSVDYEADVWLSYGGGYLQLARGATWNDPFVWCSTPKPYVGYADVSIAGGGSSACPGHRLLIHCH